MRPAPRLTFRLIEDWCSASIEFSGGVGLRPVRTDQRSMLLIRENAGVGATTPNFVEAQIQCLKPLQH